MYRNRVRGILGWLSYSVAKYIFVTYTRVNKTLRRHFLPENWQFPSTLAITMDSLAIYAYLRSLLFAKTSVLPHVS